MYSTSDTPVFTQAFNFISAAQGRVDPRTGLFLFNFPLGQIKGNDNRGPALPLTLCYSPILNANLFGLGTGMSMGLSSYDRINRMLMLSTGERYKVNEGSEMVIRHQKLDTCHVERCKVNARDGFRVIHKTGVIEYLTFMSGSKNLYLPAQIESPQGLKLTLNWDPYNRLTAIKDEANTLLFDGKYTANVATLTLWPASKTEKMTLKLSMGGGGGDQYLTRIDNISMPAEKDCLTWKLEYSWGEPAIRIAGNALLNKVIAPTGLTESVVYIAGKMKVCQQLHKTALPAVVSLTTAPGQGQPQSVTQYDYSETNYLGWNGTLAGEYSEDDDALYGMADNYTYSSTETLIPPGQEKHTVKRTYNNYHLMTEEQSIIGGCTSTEKTVYFTRNHTTFADQPSVVQMPKTKSRIWKNKEGRTRTEISEYDYEHDNTGTYKKSGNLTSQRSPDGTVTHFEYYSPHGEAGACPADPLGFTRFIKAKTITPPDILGDEPVCTMTYTYEALPLDAILGAGNRYAVVLKRKTVTASVGKKAPVTLSEMTYTYETRDKANFGRLRTQTSVIYGADRTPFTTTQTFSVIQDPVNEEALRQTVNTQTYDGLTLTSTQSHSRFTGREFWSTDAAGNKISYQYDELGRITTQTHHPDNAKYTSTETFSYLLPTLSTPPQTLHTDIHGNKTKVSYDGLGRNIRLEICNADSEHASEWHLINEISWDELGRKKAVTSHDEIAVDNGKVQKVTFSQINNWDAWGQVALTTGSDGVVHHSDVDPIALTQMQWAADKNNMHETARTVTTLDPTSHRPVRTDVKITKNGVLATYSSVTQVWDGVGRLRKATDELGHTTQWNYDLFGRVISTTYPDGSKITKDYEAFSRAELINRISVIPVGKPYIVLGSQIFDGLGRLKQTSSGGRTTTFTYEHPWQTTPSTQTGPDQITSTHILDPLLGGAITSISAKDIVQTFRYDVKTGQMTKAFEGSEQNTCTTFSPYPSGRLKTESTMLQDSPAVDTVWHYSLDGRPVTIDRGGVKETREYHPTGRLERITDDAVDVALKYDELGRLVTWTATERLTKASLVTELSFDECGREGKRKMTHSNGTVRAICQEWTVNNLLAKRFHYSKDANTAVLSETYEYDARNRLQVYTSAGSELPTDPYGNKFTKQVFVFDLLNNITRCRTTLENGSVNESRYFFENKDDPCQLSGMTNGSPERTQETALPAASMKKTPQHYPEVIVLNYDKAGRMTTDEAGRTLTYDALGRLATVTGGQYGYDAHNRMVYQKVDKTQAAHRLYYRANRLIEEWVTLGQHKPDATKDSRVRLVYAAGGCVAQAEGKDRKTDVMLTGTDAKHSVVMLSEGKETRTRVYMPYGHSDSSEEESQKE